jgi:nucleotide-binding universal stress UspA family protein
MTVHPQQPVLVGVDDADDGLLAARVGAAEARLRGLPLHLLSAFVPPPSAALPEVFVVPPHPATPGGPVAAGLAGGAASDAVLEFAFDEAALRGVPLRVVHLTDARHRCWRQPPKQSW